MTHRFFVSSAHVSLVALTTSLALTACAKPSGFPAEKTEALVTRGLDARCRLVSIGSRETLPGGHDQQRVAVHYEADCTPENGQTARRLKAVMTFSRAPDSIDGEPWIKVENRYEDDPPAARGAQAASPGPAATSASNAWSDGPECDAVLTRVAADVLPCLDSAAPDAAQQIRDWMQQARTEYRIHGDVSQRAAALLVLDEACLHQWRYRNKMLADDRPTQGCALR